MNTLETYEGFISHRDKLIDQLEAREIDKSTFIELSKAFFDEVAYRPSTKDLGSIEEGLINYQYYNIMAKWSKMTAKKLRDLDEKASYRHYKAVDGFYEDKEEETLRILDYLNYQNVEAYYIESDSIMLHGSLFEIVITSIDRGILHSMDDRVLDKCKEKRVFTRGIRPSVIDEYINSYY